LRSLLDPVLCLSRRFPNGYNKVMGENLPLRTTPLLMKPQKREKQAVQPTLEAPALPPPPSLAAGSGVAAAVVTAIIGWVALGNSLNIWRGRAFLHRYSARW
jgi:hypothetical protein